MKLFVFIGSLLLGSAAFAAPSYDLKVDLSVDGKIVSSPHLVVREGETGSITQDTDGKKIYIDVVAKAHKPKGIEMSFQYGEILANGEKQMISTPRIIALENEKASIQVAVKGEPVHEISVLAKKVPESPKAKK